MPVRCLLALLLLLTAWQPAARAVLDARSLLSASATSVGTIYSNGDLAWRSWSWGLSQLSLRDPSNPMPGARASLCMSVQPFGALSLRSPMPFALEGGVLGFYLRANSNSTATADAAAGAAASLGALELQFESSQPSRYSITHSVSLGDLLSPADLVAAAAGEWVAVKAPLSAFAQQQAEGDAPFKADRLTVGLCLQRMDGCSAGMPALDVCLDKLVIVSAAQRK
ncbi:hypothetical protein ABPG75_012580 [Micractinium tetrahymenae]